MGDHEEPVLELFASRFPGDMYRMGRKEYAGLTWVPTDETRASVREKALELDGRPLDPVERGVVRNVLTSLDFEEPYEPLSEVLWGTFGILVMDGMDPELLGRYFINSAESLDAGGRLWRPDWSTIVRVRTYQNAQGCAGILSSVKGGLEELEDSGGDAAEAASVALAALDELLERLEGYAEFFSTPEIGEGDFSGVFPFLEENSEHVGRKGIYPYILRDLYGFYENADEIDEMASSWLESELPVMLEARKALADIYGVPDGQAAVSGEMKQRSAVDREGIMELMGSLRGVLQPLFSSRVVGIPPGYRTELVSTPDYLINFIPTAAMSHFDTLTASPYNYFFVTTDAKRSPPVGLGDLFQLIVHEEYGHCVNFSSSALGFGAKPGILELLPSRLSLPISDGISFFRELESLWLLERIKEDLDAGRDPGKEERVLVDFISAITPFDTFVAEVRYVVYQWRVVRFLRATGDVRVNMHRELYTDFVNGAADRTGLEKRLIHDQLFIFQSMVGYAPSYSVGGQRLRDMQAALKARGVDPRDFNTIASSMGFSPRDHFEGELEKNCLERAGKA